MHNNFLIGKKVTVTALSAVSFGIWCRIHGTKTRGLIERPDSKTISHKSAIGSEFEAVILNFVDSERPITRQFRLSVDPKLLSRASSKTSTGSYVEVSRNSPSLPHRNYSSQNMITESEMIPLMLEASPSFAPRWQKLIDEWDIEDAPLYIALGDWSRHIVEMLAAQDVDGLQKAFAVIERRCIEGDDFVLNAATVGVLENLQNSKVHKTTKPSQFKPFLLCASLKWWDELYAFWENGELL